MRAPSVDVVVVGGGAIGVASARYLAEQGAGVVVLDARASLGAAASYGNAGLIAPSHSVPLATPDLLRRIPGWLRPGGAIYIKPRLTPDLIRFGLELARSCRRERMLRGLRALRDLSRASRDLLEDLVRDGLDAGYRRDGLMNVCRSESALEQLLKDVRLLAAEGFAPEILDARGAQRREPLLRDGIAGAVYWSEDGHCDPSRLVAGMHTAAETSGARFVLNAAVTGIERGADGGVMAVRTAQERFPAAVVVLAAGSSSAGLARLVGARIPLQPAKGYHVQIPTGAPVLSMPMLFQESVLGATPMGDALRFAGTMEFVGDDPKLRRSRALRLFDEARGYLRGLDDFDDEIETWCGFRACTPDSLPLIGFGAPTPGLLYATGHGMLGITLAAATGRAVAELALGVPSELDLEPFSPRRFGL